MVLRVRSFLLFGVLADVIGGMMVLSMAADHPWVAAVGFSYDSASDVGPPRWASLPIDNNQCGGSKNSPIDIATTSSPCDIYFDYGFESGNCSIDDMVFELTPTGARAVFSNDCERPSVSMPLLVGNRGSASYTAVGVEIRASSEHTLDGNSFAAEVRILHEPVREDRLDDDYLVNRNIAVLFQTDAVSDSAGDGDDDVFQELLNGWQSVMDSIEETHACDTQNSKNDELVSVPNESLVSVVGREETDFAHDPIRQRKMKGSVGLFLSEMVVPPFYRYDGGLTVPPCTESVEWIVASEARSISEDQYEQLRKLVLVRNTSAGCNGSVSLATSTVAVENPEVSTSTSRPVQPLNERKVDKVCPLSSREAMSGSGHLFLNTNSALLLSLSAAIGLFL